MLKETFRPLFSIAFRPFFLLTALAAFLFPTLWASYYSGHIEIDAIFFDPLSWHAHEMIFGLTGALMAGFLLTAAANWTQSKPYSGKYLILLSFCWITERILILSKLNPFYILIAAQLFFIILFFLLLFQLKNHPKQRNIFIPIFLAFCIAKYLFLYGAYSYNPEMQEAGKVMALGLIKVLILLIAGRIIPFFTQKRFSHLKINIPMPIQALSVLPVLLMAIPLPLMQEGPVRIFLLIVALIFNSLRLGMFLPHKSAKEPMLAILNIGIGWMIIHFLLELTAAMNLDLFFYQASLHSFSTGVLGSFAIGMMARVSLGHTGRKIIADKSILSAFACVQIGALARVFLPLLPVEYNSTLHISSGLWSLAFLIFLIKFTPILIRPRPDGK